MVVFRSALTPFKYKNRVELLLSIVVCLCGLATRGVSFLGSWAGRRTLLLAAGFCALKQFFFCIRGGACNSAESR